MASGSDDVHRESLGVICIEIQQELANDDRRFSYWRRTSRGGKNAVSEDGTFAEWHPGGEGGAARRFESAQSRELETEGNPKTGNDHESFKDILLRRPGRFGGPRFRRRDKGGIIAKINHIYRK
jgi:hypothetical protein